MNNSPLGSFAQPIVFFADSGYNVEALTLFQRYKFNMFYTRFVNVENWLQ
jgi:hypothetical protein